MQLTRKAVLDRIASDVEGVGNIQVHWAKLTYAGDELIARENHIAMLEPGDDIDAMAEREAAALDKMGYSWDQDAGVGLVGVRAHAARVWS